MLNPLYLLGPPLLILISIPLAIFAAVTTSIAFSTLLLRVSIVYFELGVALLHSWLFLDESTTSITRPKYQPSPPSPNRTSPSRHRHRRSSAASTTSSQETSFRKPPVKSDSFASLLGTGAPNRDFEGVGGWRVFGDGDEEALWIGMNSRLELPAVAGDRQRRHRRSLTSGSQRWSWSPDAVRISPMQSHARTPSATEVVGSPEEYFSLQPYSRMSGPSELAVKVRDDGNRKNSSSGSSTSSAGSTRTLRTAVKQTGPG